MEKLYLKATVKSPEITFDHEKGTLSFSGKSIPERTVEFYTPVLVWVKEYVKSPPQKTTCDFRLEYYNSRSKKYMMEILKILVVLQEQGKELVVNWHYEENDEDVQETGEMLKELLGININFIVVENY